jgi:hypothetical protein
LLQTRGQKKTPCNGWVDGDVYQLMAMDRHQQCVTWARTIRGGSFKRFKVLGAQGDLVKGRLFECDACSTQDQGIPMAALKGSKTEQCLKHAFAGASQANRYQKALNEFGE